MDRNLSRDRVRRGGNYPETGGQRRELALVYRLIDHPLAIAIVGASAVPRNDLTCSTDRELGIRDAGREVAAARIGELGR